MIIENEKIINKSENLILKLIKFFPALLFILYATGFIVWNVYLSKFGFFEFNVIQTRFIATGFLFLIFWFIILFLGALLVLFILYILKILYKISKKAERFLEIFLYIITFIFCLYIFINYSYLLPQYLGGSKPFSASIIGDPGQIKYLSNFNIESFENADEKEPVQTKPVCVLYQSNEFYILGVIELKNEDNKILGSPKRILIMRSDKIGGLQTGGGITSKIDCSKIDFKNI